MRPRADFVVLPEVQGAASRARLVITNYDRGAVGGGSDTPWAIGPANFVYY